MYLTYKGQVLQNHDSLQFDSLYFIKIGYKVFNKKKHKAEVLFYYSAIGIYIANSRNVPSVRFE